MMKLDCEEASNIREANVVADPETPIQNSSVEALEFESGKIKECLESGSLSSFKSLPGVYQSRRINENENEKLLEANIDTDRNRRHRDTSLERHWEEQVMAREAEQFSPHSTRRFTPGKLGKVKSWEMRIKSEEEGLPPTRTAQIQKRKRKDIANNELENIRSETTDNSSCQGFLTHSIDKSDSQNYKDKHKIKSNQQNTDKLFHNLQENIILKNENECQMDKTNIQNSKFEGPFSYEYNYARSDGKHKVDTSAHTNVTEFHDNEGKDKKIMKCKNLYDIASELEEKKYEDRFTEIPCNEVSCKKESSVNVSLCELNEKISSDPNSDIVPESISCLVKENENKYETNQSRNSLEVKENLLNAARQVTEHMSSALSPITSSQRPNSSASKSGSKIVEALNETIEDIEIHLEILSASVSRSNTPAKHLDQEFNSIISCNNVEKLQDKNIDKNPVPPPARNYSDENVKENALSPTPPPLPSEQVDNFCDSTEKELPPPPTLTCHKSSTLGRPAKQYSTLEISEQSEIDIMYPPPPPERSSSRSRSIGRPSSTSSPPLQRKQQHKGSLGQVNKIESNEHIRRGARSESPVDHGTRRIIVVRAVRSPSPSLTSRASKIKSNQCNEKNQVSALMSMPVPVQTKRNIECNSTEDLSIHNNENKSLTIIENIFEDKRLERGAEYLCNSAPNELIQTCGRRTPKDEGRKTPVNVVEGLYKAIPVLLDDSLPEDSDVVDASTSILAVERQMFLKKMLLTDHLEDDKEEVFLKQKLTTEQAEAELIILRKKQEEDEKRKMYENERRKCEAETLKLASEMKRKRDKEDLRLQKELQLKRLRQEEAKKKLAQEKVIQFELQKLKDQEDILKLGKLETLRKMITEKDKIRKKENDIKLECFNRQKNEYMQRSGMSSPISTSSPRIFDWQMLSENNNVQNVRNIKSNIGNEPCKSESIYCEESDILVDIPTQPTQSPPPQVPSPPTQSPPPQVPSPPTQSPPPQVPSPPTQSPPPQVPSPPTQSPPPQVPSPPTQSPPLQVPSPPTQSPPPQVPSPPTQSPPPQVPSPPTQSTPPQVPSPPTQSPTPQVPSPPTQSPPPQVKSPPTQSTNLYSLKSYDLPNSLNETDLTLPLDTLQYENNTKESRLPNKELTENKHISKEIENKVESSTSDTNANLISSRSGFGLGWKDVKTGLVKNRSSNYLQTNKENKENKSQIRNISKTFGNKSSSWFKSKSKSPEPVLISFVKKSDNSSDLMNKDDTNETNFDPIKTNEEDKKCNVSYSAPWRKPGKDIPRSCNNSPSLNLLSIQVKSNLTCGETENKLENVNRQNSKNISLESDCMRSVLVSQQDQYEEKEIVSRRDQLEGIPEAVMEFKCKDSQTLPDNTSELIETVKSVSRRGSRGNTRFGDEEDDFFEDSLAFEDDFSIGIELSGGALDLTSGNVTPIPTTGELEELSSIEEPTVIEELSVKPVVLIDPCCNVPSASQNLTIDPYDTKFFAADTQSVDNTNDEVINSKKQTCEVKQIGVINESDTRQENQEIIPSQISLSEKSKNITSDVNIQLIDERISNNESNLLSGGHFDGLSSDMCSATDRESVVGASNFNIITPLKSLLKKPSVDRDLVPDSDSSEEGCGHNSPKKVHFSEVDQIKLMSHDSLASMAASDCSDILPVQLCKTIMTSTPTPSVPKYSFRVANLQ